MISIFANAVMRIVIGISNSIRFVDIFMICSVANASVMLCPMVKAVIRIRIFFHFLNEYTALRVKTNKIWS